ncbi:MAG: TPM domain-containing protein [Acidobacteriota bacterium]
MRRRTLAFVARCLLPIAALLAGAPAAAQLDVPFLGGRVVDEAGLLDAAEEETLDQRLEAFEAETGSQIAVLTVPSLEGEPIEDFALRVAETWQIGRGEFDDGLLVVVSRDDRRMRIEVGYGLEGAVPDAMARRIVDGQMAPRFRNGDFAGGLQAATSALTAAIRGEELPPPSGAASGGGGGSSLFFLFLMFLAFPPLRLLPSALGGRGSGGWTSLFVLTWPFAILTLLLNELLGLSIAGPLFFGGTALLILLRLVLIATGVGPRWAERAAKSRSRAIGRRRGGPIVFGPGGGFGGGGFGGGFSGGGGGFGGGGASGGW